MIEKRGNSSKPSQFDYMLQKKKIFFGHVLHDFFKLRQRALVALCIFTCSSHRSQHPHSLMTVFKRTEYRNAGKELSKKICGMCVCLPRLLA